MKTKDLLCIGIAALFSFSLLPATAAEAPTCNTAEDVDTEESDSSLPDSGDGHFGNVYLMTNQVPNAIIVFNRGHNGNLTMGGTFPTGGDGNPVPQPGDPPTDPLASQGSLVFYKRFLFAVNAGSNEISVLRPSHNGLTMVDKVASGGTRPISLTVRGNRLYVLNEGGTPNITGFTVSHFGDLTPLADSTRPLSAADADPAQVSFSPRGDVLVVTEKHTNIIDTYTVGDDGLPKGPNTNPSNGMTPFGFAFDNCANIIVSEAFGGAPGQGAVSSYRLVPDGDLAVVSGSIGNSQTASCWIVVSKNQRFTYTTNTGSGSVSSYRIQSGGVLNLAEAVAADIGTGSSPIDMALDKSGRFLFVHAAGTRAIVSLRVHSDGGLTMASSVGGLPMGAQGIAAR